MTIRGISVHNERSYHRVKLYRLAVNMIQVAALGSTIGFTKEAVAAVWELLGDELQRHIH